MIKIKEPGHTYYGFEQNIIYQNEESNIFYKLIGETLHTFSMMEKGDMGYIYFQDTLVGGMWMLNAHSYQYRRNVMPEEVIQIFPELIMEEYL